MQTTQETRSNLPVPTRSRYRNLLWQCLFAGGILLVFVTWKWGTHRNDTETIALPHSLHGARFRVLQGQVFWRTGLDRFVIHSVPISGGKERILAVDSAEFIPPGWGLGLMFGARDILYLSHKNGSAPMILMSSEAARDAGPRAGMPTPVTVTPPVSRPSTTGGPPPLISPGPSGEQKADVGTLFLAPPKAAQTTQKGEQRSNVDWALPTPAHLHRIPFIGGQPQDVAGVSASWNTTVGGDWVYWLRLRPDDITEVRRGKEVWREITGHSDLMLTSLSTGQTRQGASGLEANAYLYADERGVFWTQPHRHPDTHRTLYYLHPDDARPNVLPDFQGILEALPPVEFQKRLYWLVSDTPNILWKGDRLYSANLDGSDLKVVLSRTQVDALLRPPLKVYHGSLYLFLHDNKQTLSGRKGGRLPPPIVTLCRLHPERPNPLEVVLNNVYGTNFDQDYLYVERTIEHRPFRDYLISDGMSIEEEQILNRYRIVK